jgi:hypothetical protein
MSASLALMIASFAGEAGHLATLAMVVLAIVLAVGVGICILRSRRSATIRSLAPNTGSCSSVTGCCRR